MRIRGKLAAAFLIIILVPVVLFAATLSTIFELQINSVAEHDSSVDVIKFIANPVQILNRMTKAAYNEIQEYALSQSDMLMDMDYLNSVNKELKKKYSFVAVRKGNEFIFRGDEEKLAEVVDELPDYGFYNLKYDSGIYYGGNEPFLVKQQDFNFSDGSSGSVFVITIVNHWVPKLRMVFSQLTVAFFLIICFTAIILIWWIYNGMVKPLNVLRIATHRMQDGDLNFSIESESKDEIGMLCNDFEEMRIRLKELIEMRMAYELDMREMISNISHDLKTPLTAIEGYAEGIMDGVADTPEKMEKYLKTIHNKANDMTVLVDELSFYSKIDNNTMPYNFKHLNLEQYFNDCISEITLDLEVKGIELGYFNYADKNLMVEADPEQLKRVINNIVGNVVKYIGKTKGILNLRIREEGDMVRIEFEDNGVGIAKKDLENIFERFYRGDASRNSSKRGSGLGLAIAKKIIEEHGGRIWATSKEGVGTTIYITLHKWEEPDVNLIEEESPIKMAEKRFFKMPMKGKKGKPDKSKAEKQKIEQGNHLKGELEEDKVKKSIRGDENE